MRLTHTGTWHSLFDHTGQRLTDTLAAHPFDVDDDERRAIAAAEGVTEDDVHILETCPTHRRHPAEHCPTCDPASVAHPADIAPGSIVDDFRHGPCTVLTVHRTEIGRRYVMTPRTGTTTRVEREVPEHATVPVLTTDHR